MVERRIVVPDVEGSNPSCRPSTDGSKCFGLAGVLLPMARTLLRLFILVIATSLVRGQTTLSAQSSYQPITGKERTEWFAVSTASPQSMAGGVISASWGTLFNRPREYGTHWEGFGKRYGMRLTGVATSNAMEAGLGALWGEDPRYFRAQSGSFGGRVGHAVKMAFLAENRRGHLMPAYARYAAISGNNFMSNAWRADSEATVGSASLRILLGFVGRISSNAFQEFWPDVRRRFSGK